MLIRSTKVKAWKKQGLLCSFQPVQLSKCPQFVALPYSTWPKRKRNEIMYINVSFETSVHSAEVAAFLRSRPHKTGEI